MNKVSYSGYRFPPEIIRKRPLDPTFKGAGEWGTV